MNVQAMLAAKGGRVATIRPDASVAELITKLKREGVGALVVSKDDAQVDGIVSERDVVRQLAEHGAALLEKRAADIMTSTVKTCTTDANIQDVMSQMTHSRFRHLPVVEDGKLCGIISIGDVVKVRLEELENETSVLRGYIVGQF